MYACIYMSVCTHIYVCMHVYICIYAYINKVQLVTVIEYDPKPSLSIATTPQC